MYLLKKTVILVSYISLGASYVSLAGLIFLLGIILTEIFLRLLFETSLEFHITVSMWLLVLMVWMGSPWTLKFGGHIQVTLITDRLSEKKKKILQVILAAIGGIFFVYFSWHAWSICLEHYSTGATGQSVWHIPKWYAWVPFCIGSSIMALQFIALSIESYLDFLVKDQKSVEVVQ